MNDGQTRCQWSLGHPLMTEYHDTEWGVPVYDDRKLYEFLVLDAAQAGLSWRTVLLKRENYRKAFDQFDIGSRAFGFFFGHGRGHLRAGIEGGGGR